MRKLLASLLLVTGYFSACAQAQTAQEIKDIQAQKDFNAQAGQSQGLNSKPNNQLLINRNEEPKLTGSQLKIGSSLNLASLIHAYPIVGFTPQNSPPGNSSFSTISNIKIVDARFDNQKVGFLPVGTDLQKSGYNTLGLQINKNLVSWLKEGFIDKHILTDSNSQRQLVIVLNKFWFSNSATDRYSASGHRLITTLYYHFDIFTSKDIGYYPQKKLSGSFSTLYNKGNAYNELTDSILALLTTELTAQNFAAKETESNWQSPADFNGFYTARIRNASHFEKMPKGVYENYTDFLEKHVLSDSVEMPVKYNNYDRAIVYACQLTAFKDGRHQACNQSWGYFDGSSLFLNTGNGFFIKLIRSKDDYVFFYLKNIKEDRIKQNILESIRIGDSPYQVLKDYTRVFALTYQLDPETGKLY